jgi:hypothetical protein
MAGMRNLIRLRRIMLMESLGNKNWTRTNFKIILAAFKGLEIIVERMNDSFKALVPINGKESILQKIYIKSEETGALFPRVIYVDLFGRIKGTGLAIKERFIPHN